MNIQYIRNNMAQAFQYTFLNQHNTPLDLTAYSSATLQIKNWGDVFQTVAAEIQSPPTGGMVTATTTFTAVGQWVVQFVVADSGGNKLWGEPSVIHVCPNVCDLSLNELPNQ